MAYETTGVPVERSQAEIRKLLVANGVKSLSFGEEQEPDGGVRRVAVAFAYKDHSVRIRVPLKKVDEWAVGRKYSRSRTKSRDECRDVLYEQEERRIWRVLAWNLKARLVAVQEEVETFEEAFLAHLLDQSTGRTIYEQLAETGRIELDAPLLALTGEVAE